MYYGKCANGECVSKLTVRAIARTGKRLFSVASKKLTEFLVLLFHSSEPYLIPVSSLNSQPFSVFVQMVNAFRDEIYQS